MHLKFYKNIRCVPVICGLDLKVCRNELTLWTRVKEEEVGFLLRA